MFLAAVLLVFGVGDVELIEIEGDTALLRKLYVHTLANESLFSKGSLNARWKSTEEGTSRSTEVDCSLLWHETATGWDYTVRESRGTPEQALEPQDRVRRLISDRGDCVLRLGRVPQYDISASRPVQLEHFMQLRPQDLWFKYSLIVPWSDFLLRTKYPPGTFRCKLSETESSVILERESIKSGRSGKIVFSKIHGWNVILSEFNADALAAQAPSPHFADRQQYEWSKTEDSNWRLARYTSHEHHPARKDGRVVPGRKVEIIVDAFDANPEQVESVLTPELFFKLPENTMVMENTGQVRRRYRFNQRIESLDSQLDALVPRLKERGFAVP